jgi:hypothetical protein
MSDEVMKLSIRVGKDLHDDVKDFLLIIRTKDNSVFSQGSSDSWAVGAMEAALIEIEYKRRREAENGDE